MKHTWPSALLITLLAACTDKSDAEYRAEIMESIHASIDAELTSLVQAGRNLQATSPSHAWRPVEDADAVAAMRESWKRMRVSYEHVECTLVALFPGTERSMNAHYEDMLAMLGTGGDNNPFDGTGITGMHGIERILYAPTIRPEVVAFERTLSGYEAAAYPATDADAIAFKTVLVQLLIDQAAKLRKEWQPLELDAGIAFQGMIELMNEQRNKVNLAATGEEESRYANLTLFDLRNNLDGMQKIYRLFREWVRSKADGAKFDAMLQRKFDALAALYDMTNAITASDALPEPPDGWSSDQPTPADLATPFGTLWQAVHESVDPNASSSVVSQMNHIAALLGFRSPASPAPSP
jgi:iron uptake system component EfeO